MSAALSTRADATSGRPVLISFSGLDGSGKSTQIAVLRSCLAEWGYRDKLLTFWDDVVVLSRYREGFVHKIFKSEQGIGSPDKPVNRRDKNVRGWHLTLARHGLYLLDALHLRRVVARARRGGAGVILMDRYIYDELANLPRNWMSLLFVRLVAVLVPRPDLAFLLDADPEAARARKPEYPVEFMRECRSWYHHLQSVLGTMTLVPPLPLEQAQAAVVAHARTLLEEKAGRQPPAQQFRLRQTG
jgi:thymidylate kinase